MIQVLIIDLQAGAKTLHTPRRVKGILDEIFLSDQPFAARYRQFFAEQNRKAPWEPAGLVGKTVEVRD